ncbi:MAG: rhodanese-like domain-containing protein [Bacillota bacterium]
MKAGGYSLSSSVGVAAMLIMLVATAVAARGYVSPEHVPGATTIDGVKAWELWERGVIFIDVRIASDYEAGHIPDAINLTIERDEAKSPFTEQSLLEVLGSKDREVVFYCNAERCWRSSVAAERAVSWGFTRVYYYRLGFPDWQRRNYPVE